MVEPPPPPVGLDRASDMEHPPFVLTPENRSKLKDPPKAAAHGLFGVLLQIWYAGMIHNQVLDSQQF